MDPDVGFGQHDELSERAVAIHTHAGRPDAQVTPSGAAVSARPARDVSLPGHLIAHPDVTNPQTELDHLTAELMTGYQGRVHRARRPRVPRFDVQISATNT